MKNKSRKFMGSQVGKFLFLIFVTAFCISGCGSSSSSNRNFTLSYVQRAIVFPFENLSGQQNDAGKKLTSIFSTSFYTQTKIEVIEQGEIERFITEERIRGVDALSSDVLRLMHSRFNAQVVVIGIVSEYGYVQIGETVPVVGLSVRILEPRNGALLWSCTKTREGTDSEGIFGIGKVRSLSRLSQIVVDDILSQMSSSSTEIAQLIETGGRVPILSPEKRSSFDNAKVSERTATTGTDEEERQEINRAVKRYWERIKEKYEK